MEMPPLPSAQSAFDDLRPLLPLLFTTLETGNDAARDFFESVPHEVDPHLFADITRYTAKHALDSACADLDGFRRIRQTNNGLCVHYGPYRIRILNSADGDLPAPRHSWARRRFYRQSEYVQTALASAHAAWARDDVAIPVSLVVLWRIDRKKNVLRLLLVMPKPGAGSRFAYERVWSREVPHPVEMIDAEQSKGNRTETTEDLDIDDLLITFADQPDDYALFMHDDLPIESAEESDDEIADDERALSS